VKPAPRTDDLFDAARIAREYGVSRAAAEAFMRQCAKVRPDGLRKVYVRRSELERVIAESTVR
jgi:hypothetical protein